VIRLLNWVTKVIIQTLIMVTLTIYLTWIAVHTYVDKLLTKYHMDTAQSKIQFSDFLSNLSVSLNILKPSSLNNQAAAEASEPIQSPLSQEKTMQQTQGEAANNTLPITQSISPTPTATPSASPTDAKSAGTGSAPDDTVPVWNQTSNESNQQGTKTGKQKDLVMSAEQFTQKKNQLTEADKMKIFTLLAARLPEAEFQQISSYVEDGITEEEWTAIQALVEKYVKPEEYKELQDLLAQY
jgi:hypothetical protein